ncbi:ribonuclease III [Chloroflexota bacterium]
MVDLDNVQQALGVSFNDRSLLEQALVHSSYINENPAFTATSNERMEFLGDAVLGCVIAEKLYQDFPGLDEGEMTRLRSALVRRESLASVAGNIGLGGYIYLGKGEETSGGRRKLTNLAAALEAVIAAVYLDQGLAVTRDFILCLFRLELEGITSRRPSDYKSQLQELTQSSWRLSPAYRLVETTGPDHDKTFTVEVMVGDKVLGQGEGKSKRVAETDAARLALEHTDFTDTAPL